MPIYPSLYPYTKFERFIYIITINIITCEYFGVYIIFAPLNKVIVVITNHTSIKSKIIIIYPP